MLGAHLANLRNRAALADVPSQGIGALRGGTLDVLLELGLEIVGRHSGKVQISRATMATVGVTPIQLQSLAS